MKTQPNCELVIGFIDHFGGNFPPSTLIAELSGAKVGGQNAVVRLLCGKQMNHLRAKHNQWKKTEAKRLEKVGEQ